MWTVGLADAAIRYHRSGRLCPAKALRLKEKNADYRSRGGGRAVVHFPLLEQDRQDLYVPAVRCYKDKGDDTLSRNTGLDEPAI